MRYLDTVWLFFPAAGNCNNGSVRNVGSNGYCWSSSVNSSNVQNAYNLNFNSGNVNWQNNNNRLNGFPVRGVLVEHSFCLCAIDKTIAFFLCIH